VLPDSVYIVILYTDHSNEKRERKGGTIYKHIVVEFIACIKYIYCLKNQCHLPSHTHTRASQNYNLVLHGRRFRLLLFLLHDVVSPVSIYKTNFVVLHGIRPHSSASIHAILLPFD